MKKICSILLAILLIFQVNVVVFAAQTPTVSSQDVILSEDEVLIPVKIDNNCGLMGYKITVKYDKTKVEVCSVTKGNVSAKGNFVTNFNTDSDTFDIVWNNTDNVTKNGNLFVLSAKAKKNSLGKSEIKLSYSQPDTFDVTYTDVPLNCKNINVTFKSNEKNDDVVSDSTSKVLDDNSFVADDSQILDAINALLRKEGKSSLDEIEDKEKFLNELNKYLNTITESDKNNIKDFEFLKELYKRSYQNSFINEVKDNIDGETMKKIIDDSLKEYNVNEIKYLKDNDKKSFITSMQTKLQKSDSDIPNISDDLSSDDAIETFEKLESENKIDDKSQDKEENKQKTDKYTIIIILFASCLFLFVLILLFVKKMKKQ